MSATVIIVAARQTCAGFETTTLVMFLLIGIVFWPRAAGYWKLEGQFSFHLQYTWRLGTVSYDHRNLMKTGKIGYTHSAP